MTTSYENPLRPVIPTALHAGGGTIDSCADPMVIKGQAGETQDELQLWYLHVWTWQENRSGLFADWNPAVKC